MSTYELWDVDVGVGISETDNEEEMRTLVGQLIAHHGPGQADVLAVMTPDGLIGGKELLEWLEQR